jgi:hypothetical protein
MMMMTDQWCPFNSTITYDRDAVVFVGVHSVANTNLVFLFFEREERCLTAALFQNDTTQECITMTPKYGIPDVWSDITPYQIRSVVHNDMLVVISSCLCNGRNSILTLTMNQIRDDVKLKQKIKGTYSCGSSNSRSSSSSQRFKWKESTFLFDYPETSTFFIGERGNAIVFAGEDSNVYKLTACTNENWTCCKVHGNEYKPISENFQISRRKKTRLVVRGDCIFTLTPWGVVLFNTSNHNNENGCILQNLELPKQLTEVVDFDVIFGPSNFVFVLLRLRNYLKSKLYIVNLNTAQSVPIPLVPSSSLPSASSWFSVRHPSITTTTNTNRLSSVPPSIHQFCFQGHDLVFTLVNSEQLLLYSIPSFQIWSPDRHKWYPSIIRKKIHMFVSCCCSSVVKSVGGSVGSDFCSDMVYLICTFIDPFAPFPSMQCNTQPTDECSFTTTTCLFVD